MTPYYDDGSCVILHGDCREIVPTLDIQVDLVLTDPPYGINWKPRVNHQDSPWTGDATANIRPLLIGRHHCFWGGNMGASMRLRFRNKRRRIERVQQAAERQAAYDALTPQQKFDRIVASDFSGLGASKRGTTRLILNFGGDIKT
jgi:hypothetical protein